MADLKAIKLRIPDKMSSPARSVSQYYTSLGAVALPRIAVYRCRRNAEDDEGL